MGRLRKAKIDRIIRLRSKGYTQNETAEKVDVNLKTVRKYDPVKRPKYLTVSLEEKVRCLEHLVHYLMGYTLVMGAQFDQELYSRPNCPHCESKTLLSVDGNQLDTRRTNPWIHTWACPKCGFFIDTYQRIDPVSVKKGLQMEREANKQHHVKDRASQTGTRQK